MDSNVQPGVGKFGCNWLEWFARGQGIWRQIFEKCQIPTPYPASPPHAGLTLIGALLRGTSLAYLDVPLSYLVLFYYL